MTRKIAVVTVGRSDFGLLTPVLQEINNAPELELQLVVSGAHLSPEFGWTSQEIEKAGFEVAESIDMLLSADTPAAISKSVGLATIGFAQAWDRLKPDMIVLLGDRFEMHAAAMSAVPFRIPLAHIHGGEITIGAIDEVFRHSITKFSHLHFTATREYANRVIQMGEEPWRVTVSGAPGIDHLQTLDHPTIEEIETRLDCSLDTAPLLVTYHPVTLEFEQAAEQTQNLCAALAQFDRPIVITKPNADTNGRVIIQLLEQFAQDNSNVRLVDNLGSRMYFGVARHAAAMVGNSSSGIVESASFKLPVVNIGIRQEGRTRSKNVIDTGNATQEIVDGIRKALSPEFVESLSDLQNSFGDGHATQRIVDRLRDEPLTTALTTKRFHDLPPATATDDQSLSHSRVRAA